MKIVLDLDHSINNYHWESKEELKDYIRYMLGVLWEHQKELADSEKDFTNLENRLYDILDMFSKFEIIEKEQTNDNTDNNIANN